MNMTKTILGMLLPAMLVLLATTSCNDEDRNGDVTINISIANVYGNMRDYSGSPIFGKTDDESHKFRLRYQIWGNGKVVSDNTVLLSGIYDVHTVKEKNIPDGTYSIDVFTDIVETDARGSITGTSYEMRDNVSGPGMQISSRGTLGKGRYDVCGAASQEFRVSDGAVLTIAPECMGNLLSMYIFNAAECDYFLYSLPASFANYPVGQGTSEQLIIRNGTFDGTPKADAKDEYFAEHFLPYTGEQKIEVDWKSSATSSMTGIWVHKGNLIKDTGETWRLRINASTGDYSMRD